MTSDEKTHFFDKPGNLKKFLRGFYILCAILLVVDFVHLRAVLQSCGTIDVVMIFC